MNEKLNLFFYELKNALIGMFRHWALCLSSIVTIFLTLSLIGVFFLAELHIDKFMQNAMGELTIHLVLEDDMTESADIEALEQEIRALDNVADSEFSSKDQELELMIEEKGEAFTVYRGEDNPLNNAFFVYVEDESLMNQTAIDLQNLNGVKSAVYGGTSVRDLVKVLTAIRYIAFGLVLLLFVLSIYLIFNTIRAAIYSRQKEISIMRTVGATSSFIRIPFEIEGILIGLIGGLIPWLMIYKFYPLLYDYMSGNFFISAFRLLLPYEVNVWMAGVLMGSGMIIGWIASFTAANKYIKNTR